MGMENFSHISEKNCHMSKALEKNYEITEERGAFLGALESLTYADSLVGALQHLFSFLQDFVPITYLFYTPPYESQTSNHIYISKDGVRFIDNMKSPTHGEIKRIFEHREQFSTQKTFYIHQNKKMDDFFNILTMDKVKICSPCLYFYFLFEGQVQGSIYFGCSQEKEFTPEERVFLERLWKPLYFIIRFTRQQSRLEEILKITQENNRSLRKQVSGFSDIVGVNSGLKDVAREIRMLAPFDIPVLITGETGTGKDLFASELHRLSPRHEKPFVPVNCGGIAPTLIDSELFGYARGAFTGALKDYKGRFERAQGGTIFLDEVGELSIDAQTRLLRVIQNHTVEVLGGSVVSVDFRLVCATNRDLPALVREGKFREDLFFRLAGVTVRIPSLRERLGDIPLLIQDVLQKEAVHYGVPVPAIAEGEMQKMLDYDWPGNVRELIHVVTEGFVRSFESGMIVFRVGRSLGAVSRQVRQNVQSFADMQREYFEQVLRLCDGRISGPRGAAELAGLKPNTLRAKLDKLGILYGRRAGE